MPEPKFLAFTYKANVLVNVLQSKVVVSANRDLFPNAPNKGFVAIWDTGATNTCISKKVADQCGLIPTGQAKSNTANGECIVNTYLIDIILPNNVGIRQVPATEFTAVEGADLLIGMDIIKMGDLSVSNYENSTMFSFRIPSIKHTDFVQESKEDNTYIAENIPRRNSKCPCGSNKKYKQCCGR